MGKIDNCLTKLAIIATSGGKDDVELRTQSAIAAYLEQFPRDGTTELMVLGALLNGLEALKLQTSASAIIWRAIINRICEVDAREPITGARLDVHPVVVPFSAEAYPALRLQNTQERVGSAVASRALSRARRRWRRARASTRPAGAGTFSCSVIAL